MLRGDFKGNGDFICLSREQDCTNKTDKEAIIKALFLIFMFYPPFVRGEIKSPLNIQLAYWAISAVYYGYFPEIKYFTIRNYFKIFAIFYE